MARQRAVVAIDGPAGAGKTTVSQLVARALGYPILGTGALYRAVALAAQQRGIAWHDEPRVAALAEELGTSGAIVVELDPEAGQRIRLSGEDVSEALGTERMGGGASQVSASARVRAALLDLQRRAGHGGGVVLEGRDIGTVVFPDAEAKFFLTASAEVRAERRYRELVERGVACDLAAIRREVSQRDRRDATRETAPLTQAPDARVVDSSALTVAEVVAIIVERVRAIEQSLAVSG
jgi:cytidylate kinase